MTEEIEPAKNFKERMDQVVVVEINGKKYHLKQYTMLQETELKRLFSGDLKIWQRGFDEMDAETLMKTLWLFLEDRTQFKEWTDVAAILAGDLGEKINIMKAVLLCQNAGMPEVQKSVKKRMENAKKQVLILLKGLSTGAGFTTASTKPMDGPSTKSKIVPITK